MLRTLYSLQLSTSILSVSRLSVSGRQYLPPCVAVDTRSSRVPWGPRRPCVPQVYWTRPEVDMYMINDQCVFLRHPITRHWFLNCMWRRCRKFVFAEAFVNVGIKGKVRAVIIVQLVARLLPALMHLEAATCQGCQMYLVPLCPSYGR